MNLIERIQKIIEENELSAAAFADKIGVQRSSISHILSGRNKPSLDFILKILNAFPTIQSSWLLLGAESEVSETSTSPSLFPPTPTKSIKEKAIETPIPDISKNITDSTPSSQNKEVERVTVFYSDGTCSTYTNKK